MQENHSPTLFQKMQNYQSEGRRKEILIKCKKSYTKLHRGAGALAPVLAFIYIIFKAPWNFFAVVFRLEVLDGLESLGLSSILTNAFALQCINSKNSTL